MHRHEDSHPTPPDLPSFTVEEGTPPAERTAERVAERHNATGLVRHDLPTYALAKKILREEVVKCGNENGCSARNHAYERLERDHGYTFLRAMYEFGEIGRETLVTQPLAFLPMFWSNFKNYLIPIPWIDEDLRDWQGVVAKMKVRSSAQAAFWEALARGPQYFGWILAVMVLLLPVGIGLSDRKTDWPLLAMLSVVLAVAAFSSAFRTVARTQAELFIPAAIAAGRSMDALGAAWRRRIARPSVIRA